MKYLVVVSLFALAACSPASGGGSANIIGAHDLVLVDDRPSADAIVNPSADAGVPNRYLFITSTDTNELRVLNMYRPPLLGRGFMRAPNPLESLSIPVLDRPQMLAVDEGLSHEGRRVTGAYVYAARVGGSQLSVVDASPAGLTQMTPSPLAVGAPITALTTWMGHNLTSLPLTTRVYYATYDGDVGVLWSLELPMQGDNRAAQILAAKPEVVLDVSRETIVALQMIAPLAGRTLDSQPFCDASACLAIATRKSAGEEGRSLLIELDTLRSARLAFPGPVRDFAAVGHGERLYATLDEEKCDSASCGGVIAIDTQAGTRADGFPIAKDFTGAQMAPLTAGGSLPRGIALGEYASILQFQLLNDAGVVAVAPVQREYSLLGLYSTSAGEVVAFDGFAASAIDFDGRRPKFTGGAMRLPTQNSDGGFAFFDDDGGATFGTYAAEVDGGPIGEGLDEMSATWFEYSATTDAGDPLSIRIADGYLVAQSFRIVYQGVLNGFEALSTTPADGVSLAFPSGLSSRVLTGDRVVFGQYQADGGLASCGAAQVAGLDGGRLVIDAEPAGCANRVVYSVRAGQTKPVVMSGTVEGFMGRASQGETLTYTRAYIARPDAFDVVHPALTVSFGQMPEIAGAYWELGFNGFLNPYRFSFDVGLCSTSGGTIMPGHLVMGALPSYVSNTATLYGWGVMALYPAVNGVAEAPLSQVIDNGVGLVSAGNGVTCWR